MQKTMLNIFIFLSLCVLTKEDHLEDSKDIVDLNSTSFKEMVSQFKTSSVLFYAPWCGHCKHIMPEYEQTCIELNKLFPGDVLCARLDCTKNEAICTEHQLQGYPTLKVLRDSYECLYNGPRSAESILSWVKSTHNAIRDINDAKQLQELFESSKECLVAYFNDAAHPMRKFIEEISCSMPSLSVILTSNEEFAKKESLEHQNALYLFKERKLVHQIQHVENVTDLLRSLFFHLNSLVPEYDYENVQAVFSQGVTRYLAFVYNSSEELTASKELLENFAKDKFGEVRVFTLDARNDKNKNIVDYFKLKDFPRIVFYNDEIQRFYHYSDDITTTSAKLGVFFSGCLDGSIKHYVKKQPVPENWDKNSVKELVVDNFEQVFEKYEKGVILFYAAWCGHCEALMPTWYKIGEDVAAKYPSIFVARIDHVENDIPDITVEGYPTIYAFTSRNEKVLYEGGRNYDEILEFINKTLELEKLTAKDGSESEKPTAKDASEL